jgi:hypothetical protein
VPYFSDRRTVDDTNYPQIHWIAAAANGTPFGFKDLFGTALPPSMITVIESLVDKHDSDGVVAERRGGLGHREQSRHHLDLQRADRQREDRDLARRRASWASIVASTANDGTYTWAVSGPGTTQARIRVTSGPIPPCRIPATRTPRWAGAASP